MIWVRSSWVEVIIESDSCEFSEYMEVMTFYNNNYCTQRWTVWRLRDQLLSEVYMENINGIKVVRVHDQRCDWELLFAEH